MARPERFELPAFWFVGRSAKTSKCCCWYRLRAKRATYFAVELDGSWMESQCTGTSSRRLFSLAEVDNGLAHRFRDTFAVELLLAGVPIERVSVLLGHESVLTTEGNYAPRVRSRQEQLEADLGRAWRLDPVIARRVVANAHAGYTRGIVAVTHTFQRENWRRGWVRTHEWRFWSPVGKRK